MLIADLLLRPAALLLMAGIAVATGSAVFSKCLGYDWHGTDGACAGLCVVVAVALRAALIRGGQIEPM